MRPRVRDPRQLGLALAASVALALLVFRLIPLRLDMAGFLPSGHDVATRFLLREVRSGIAGTVLSVGIDGADDAELARLSRALQASLVRDARFAAVLNGSIAPDDSAAIRDLYFPRRYLLAPDGPAHDFSAPALDADFSRALDTLGSSAEPVLQDIVLRDPTDAFLRTMQGLQPDTHARLEDGVWFAPDQHRALLLIRTRASGMDIAGQKSAQDGIRAAFAAAHPGHARLVLSGPAAFAVESAAGMRHDIELMSVFSTLFVIGVLYWRFRSLWVLAAIGVPFLLSLSVAMVVVRLVFGYVHGIAFGFGMTMLGVALDYPVLLIGHRDAGEAPQATLRRIAASLRLAVLTATLGLSGMMLCGLPGLEQLGVFAAAGLLTAALVTLHLMPRLIVAADLAPSVSGPSTLLARAERWRHARAVCVLPVAAALVILWHRPPVPDTDVSSLSPIPAAARAQDVALRRELGAPDPSLVIAVRGTSAQEVLEREEALIPVFDRLRAKGAVSGFEDAAQFSPSIARQHARALALPDSAALRASVRTALAGLPFQPDAFDGFMADVEASRRQSPLQPADLAHTPLGAAIAPLLFQRADGWWGLVLPEAVRDRTAIMAAFAGHPDAMAIDLHDAVNGLTAHHTGLALRWMAAGAGLALAVLTIGLRDVRRIARVLAAVGAAMIVLLAMLDLRAAPLSLIHLVSIQFVLGVGLDYALFLARPQLDGHERARTMRTLLTCNVMTILTFGLLGFCQSALLQEIGTTVAGGVALAMLFGFLLAGQLPDRTTTNGR
ncbi:MMPL family transporter [Tanticharoenia sakaeratensis]|uniref:Membrane transport protein MMPL domain-containing protein n=1 Tax=Tanticharoenia sakaeratensis NBRC 103193 TaxID=1231623 RepID=A0A0D6ML97_9PROT|nr:MMPL family transporter [Tanticharoenia sakaeratensis]GAN54053.1 hypothetical protein Tasa_015_042 [Tanticharoenia sakaeratensis NBRC 103193]GBQ23706.1 hypothetical protein AA103193_2506 [Tanticharoenia sakaeratensis NBRC 103193]